jgi:hypothetical protein
MGGRINTSSALDNLSNFKVPKKTPRGAHLRIKLVLHRSGHRVTKSETKFPYATSHSGSARRM